MRRIKGNNFQGDGVSLSRVTNKSLLFAQVLGAFRTSRADPLYRDFCSLKVSLFYYSIHKTAKNRHCSIKENFPLHIRLQPN
jgi:hypothetical protein